MKRLDQTFNDMGFKDEIKTSLEVSFHEALKNEEFKKFVSRLKISKDELMKYTSQLETSFAEFQGCLHCKSIMECKNDVPGYAYLPKVVNDKLVFSYVPCAFQKKIIAENKHLKNMYFADIPKEIEQASMSKIFTDDKNRFKAIEWLTTFIKNYKVSPQQKGLYLSGSFGSGKTYLIAAAFNELAKDNVRSAVVYWPEFLRNLKGSFQTDFNEKFEYIKKRPLLLLDDLGAENSSSWSRDEILGPILQYRMQQQLPTFFTSNLTIKELEQHFSIVKDNVDLVKAKRIMERIIQLTDNIELLSKNLRK